MELGEITRLTSNVAERSTQPSLSRDGRRLIVSASRIQREVWKVPNGPDPDANGRAAVRMIDTSLELDEELYEAGIRPLVRRAKDMAGTHSDEFVRQILTQELGRVGIKSATQMSLGNVTRVRWAS